MGNLQFLQIADADFNQNKWVFFLVILLWVIIKYLYKDKKQQYAERER